jgi:threonine dehydrogenase-like Zn-dependent dehydrogenase
VEKDDPMLYKGLPNLSKKMKHLGIHINGVFADYMDFPEYNVHKIEGAEQVLSKIKDKEQYYNQMVMMEPLACVQRGYKLLQKQDYFNMSMIKTVLIIGAGPMGVIHAVHLKNKYPNIKMEIYDIDPIRRKLAKNVKFIKPNIINQYDKAKEYDLVVNATSNSDANIRDSVKLVRNNGIILLFSGIDMQENEQHPLVGAVDMENVHRYEGSVRLINYDFGDNKKSIYFIGTSGYVTENVEDSIRELNEDFLRGEKSVYKDISTTQIKKLDSRTAVDISGNFQNAVFNEPAIIPLLKLYAPDMQGIENVHNYLKIIIKN